MKKILKIFLVILALSIIVSLIASCKKKNKQENSTQNNEEEVIYSTSTDALLVLGAGVDSGDVKVIKSAYYDATGKSIEVARADEKSGAHEIVVGETDREISRKAYRFLATLEKEDEEDVGYVIYSDGKSVAIAFSEASYGVDISLSEALLCFVEKCLTKSSLKLSVGVFARESFDPVTRQQMREDEDLEKLWQIKREQILEKVEGNECRTEEIITELLDFYKLYDSQGIVKWLSSLYDPVSGGFYYSNSARDNIGYSADLESTAQALGIVESLLIGYEGTVKDYFGEEIATSFVKFTKDMQSADNGYFYHPQWARETVDRNPARQKRDVYNALYILDSFGAAPTYDVEGVEGDGKMADGTPATASSVVMPLGTSAESAVRLVSSLSDDDYYIDPHLKTEEAFVSYLESLYIASNPAQAAETIEKQAAKINYRDEQLADLGESYRLAELCIAEFSKCQYSQTGLWIKKSAPTFDDLGNAYKVMRVYNALGTAIPNAMSITSTVGKLLNTKSEDLQKIDEVATCWTTLATLVTNIRTYGMAGNEISALMTLGVVYSNISDYLSVTKENLRVFLRIDGSFSGEIGHSAALSYGMPVAVSNMEEGDVNATVSATKSIWLSIFNVFGIGTVPVYNVSDRMLFQRELADMGVIIKNEIVSAEPLDFEDYEDGKVYDELYKEAYSEGADIRVKDVGGEHGKVINITSTPIASKIDQYRFPLISSTSNATCFILETDICVLPETSEGYFGQMYIYPDTYMIYLNRSGDTVRIFEESSRSSTASYSRDLGYTAKIGEWFNLRVEYYPGNDSTVRIKIYFNGSLIAVTDNYFDSPPMKFDGAGVPANSYGSFAFYALHNYNVNILFDNIIAEKNYKSYTAVTDPSLLRNVDSPETDRVIHGFEGSENLPSSFGVVGDTAGFSVVRTEEGSVLSLNSYSSKLKLPINVRGPKTNSALVSFDLNVDPSSEVGASYSVDFKEFCGSGRSFAEFIFFVEEKDGKKFLSFADGKGGKVLNVYSDVKLSLGVTYRIELRLYSDDDVAVLFVDDVMAGINMSTLAKQKRYYMGEVYLSILNPDKSATAYVDNLVCERMSGDYSSVSSPTADRVTHTFDSFGALENNGVSIESGEVNFESATKGAFVKIPLNERASVPTMAYASLDINASYRLGCLIISFTDNGDNVISAFTLKPYDGGCDIYEMTENGIYKTPIATVTNSQFKLSFEYSYTLRGFSIFVDNVCVACSSMTYNDASAALELKTLKISTENGAAAVKVDNAVFESTATLYKIPTLSASNPDDTAVTMTYESSSFASLPSRISTNSIHSTGGAVSIKEKEIRGEITKVLEFNSGNDSRDYLIFKMTDKRSGFNAVAFETDIMLLTQGNRLTGEFCPKSQSSSGYRMWLSMSVGGRLEVSSADFKETLDICSGEWFTLRYEYASTSYDFNYDGSPDVYVKVYINGVLVGTGYTPYATPPVLTDTISEMRVGVDANRGGKIYFDNTKYESCSLEIPEPIAPDTDTLTYEPGVVTDKTTATFASNGSLKIVDKTVGGEVSKVLSFATASGGEDKLDISVTRELEGANAVTFETDIMITPTSDTAELTLEPTTASGAKPFRLTIKAYKDGNVTISSKDIAETVIGKCGEWIHLRVDYMNPRVDYDGDKVYDILYKVYVDGSETPIATGYKPYTAGVYYNPNALAVYRFTTASASAAEILLDNTRFWRTELTPDEAPEEEIPEASGEGVGDEDSFGWS